MTGRERELIAYLHDTITRTGKCPTIRVIGEQLGRHEATISRMLSRFEVDGYIKRNPNRHREYVVVPRAVFKGLTYTELAWCQANPERVRAMMRLAGEWAQV